MFQSRNPSDGFLACLTGLSRPFTTVHVIAHSLPTARGTGSLKHPRNLGASEESKSLGLIGGFIVEPILAAKFSYLLFVDIVGI